jgi:PadR family transcriptional regulator PadR
MDPNTFLPLSEITLYILLSLMSDPKHGYAIWKDVEYLSNGSFKLSTSTLYDALERLLEQGLIERIKDEREQSSGRPRKRYRINDLGKHVLAKDINRMRVLVDLAVTRSQEIM